MRAIKRLPKPIHKKLVSVLKRLRTKSFQAIRQINEKRSISLRPTISNNWQMIAIIAIPIITPTKKIEPMNKLFDCKQAKVQVEIKSNTLLAINQNQI